MSPALAETWHRRELPGEYEHRRWRGVTTDGTVPWGVFWMQVRHLQALRVQEQMNLARAIGLAFADPKKPDSRRLVTQTVAAAYPADEDEPRG